MNQNRFLLLPFGDISYIKEGTQGTFCFSIEDATNLLFNLSNRRIRIDFEHESLNNPCVQWIGYVERFFIQEEGLYVLFYSKEKWTSDFKLSPVLELFNHHVINLISIALTRSPAIQNNLTP